MIRFTLTVVTFTPLVLFLSDAFAVALGIDRMNEIDRVTAVTLWIAASAGLVAGVSGVWLALKRKSQALEPKQWLAVLAWGPLSALFFGWTANWLATLVPGETKVVPATITSFRTGGRSLCQRHVTLLRRDRTDQDEICLTGGLGRNVGPEDLSVDEEVSLTVHVTPVGSTVESIEHGGATNSRK